MNKRRPPRRDIWRALLLALVVFAAAFWQVSAQEGPPEVTEPAPEQPGFQPDITFDDFEPKRVTTGQSFALSVLGSNFVTDDLVVRLEGFGVLTTNRINSNALTASVPAGVPPGEYRVLIIQPGKAPVECACPDKPKFMKVDAIPPTQGPTREPPAPPTQAPPPTTVPGAPTLLVRTFSASPSSVAPGGTVTFSVEIINVGTRPALGLTVSVDPGGKFIPANGQATILLPDLGVNAGTVVSIPVIVAEDAAAGPQSVPITMTFRDFTGESYTAKGTLTVVVQSVSAAAQITLARYLFEPNPAQPGKAVTLTLLLTNTGNASAGQVLVRIADGGVLLAGPQGDSFPVGDLAAGASASIEMPLIVSASAKPGPQPQTVNITHLENGESKQSAASMTLDITKIVPTAPVMLLDMFDTGGTFLQPGEQFTANITLKNVGREAAENMLVTFGTATTTTGTGDGTGTGGTGTGTGSTTNPSTTFAPLGSGGTIFAGTIAPDGGSVNLTQEFIVSGSVETGIYTLPITLRYQKSDGTTVTDTLSASLVVVLPPRLSLELQSPLPEQANTGEPLFLTLSILNRGRKAVNFSAAEVTADNAEVLEGAETTLSSLRTEDETAINASIMPLEEGPVTINITLHYIDDLNKPQTITQTYELEAVLAPPPPTFEPPPDSLFPPTAQDSSNGGDGLLGRLLLGLLGLGS